MKVTPQAFFQGYIKDPRDLANASRDFSLELQRLRDEQTRLKALGRSRESLTNEAKKIEQEIAQVKKVVVDSENRIKLLEESLRTKKVEIDSSRNAPTELRSVEKELQEYERALRGIQDSLRDVS